MKFEGVFMAIVHLLWSESVDEFVNLKCFPPGLVYFQP